MISLIYASVAAQGCEITQLTEILQKSRDNNQRRGLTGILLHSTGSFLQVLEGDPEVVDRLYETILLDKRHEQISVIIREPIPKRYFGNWSMGFSDITPEELTNIAGMNDFFQSGSSFTQIDASRAKKLVAAFAKGRWRAKLGGPIQRVA